MLIILYQFTRVIAMFRWLMKQLKHEITYRP